MEKVSGHVISLHMSTKNHDHMMYASWDMEYDRNNFLSFWAIFCPFTPLLTPKTKIWKNVKKTWRYYLLHMCTMNEDHMMYGSWDIRHNRERFLSFWAIFCPLTPLTTQKIKILKKWKKMPRDIIILHMCTINENHMMYGSWDMEHDRQFFLILDHFLPFYPLTTQKSIILKKNEKNTGRYHHFTQVHQKSWSSALLFLRYGTWQMQLFFILGYFLPFYLPNSPKNQN